MDYWDTTGLFGDSLIPTDGLTPRQQELARTVVDAGGTGTPAKDAIANLDATEADKEALRGAFGGPR